MDDDVLLIKNDDVMMIIGMTW